MTEASRHSAVRKQQNKTDQRQSGGPYRPLLLGSWQLNAGIALVCALATTVLYAGDPRLGFFRIDDPQYVVSNPWIRGVSLEHVTHVLTNPYYLNYSPVHLLSYMLDYALAGLDAWAFHLSSNIWAGIVAGFVYLVALALTQQRIAAVIAALLFVVHPVHVEAVAWISNRKDLVAAAFILPSFLAYLQYRRDGAKTWYIVSLLLFLFALLGKLSVAAFPAVLIALDLFIEKRPLGRSLIDKVPFLAAATVVAMAVEHAQPSTGAQPDMSIIGNAFAQSMWLLTGLGNYVIYRVPPGKGDALAQLAGIIILLGAFLVPLLLRKPYPLATVLIYWILFTYLPTQVLPFSYPVTDRYLFLPSVGAVILIAWLSVRRTDQFQSQKWKIAAATALVAVVSLIWLKKTVDYLSEWQDPRSVWFAATRKSHDVHVYYELGWEYLYKAASFGTTRRNAPLPADEAKSYASAVWKDDPRLSQLLSELSDNRHNGPAENAFREYLQSKASENLDEALARKKSHVMPDLFLSRGVLFVDTGDLQSAKKEFLAGIGEVSQLPSSEGRPEALIWLYYNLGVAEGTLGNFKQALSWMRLAEEEQAKYGTTLIPELAADREKIESIATKLHQ